MAALPGDQWLPAARQWTDWDLNTETKMQIQQLVDSKNVERLQELFSRRVTFGTAGLRAVMGPGPSAINDLVVIQTSQGLCTYLVKQLGEQAKLMGVALGYDHRQQRSLSSKRFAELTASVCLHRGFRVYLYEDVVATPLVPFCVEQKGCAAGVMVTASHNPRADNGYKVYWSNGCQIIAPHDEGIAHEIVANLAPWRRYDESREQLQEMFPALLEDPSDELIQRYFARAGTELCRFPEANASTTLTIAYTAMHGVGHVFTSRTFAAFKHKEYVPVQAQLLPDPEFPTVAFPNPEEGKGALQLAMETAEASGARLILANDPDADRLAVAERDADSESGWRIFTGNEIGVLLGHWELEQYVRLHPDCDRKQLYFVASTVSSKMLRAVAETEGLNFVETLTGFKWMGNKTAELREAGKTVLFSFEEAIGFCVGGLVKDKDGVIAAAVFAEMAVQLEATKQMTVAQHLNALYGRYGYFVTQNHYVKCYDPVKIRAIFERLRNGGKYWDSCGDYAISHVRDLTTGYDSSQPDKRAVLPVSSSTEMITYTFANGCVATLRTSGTEPKLKYYVELAGRVGQTCEEVTVELRKQVTQVVQQMLQPRENGLELAPADE
uniref:Phosphoglucomutase n=1 Tax=Peronospora matthiolae TaxID=2874970 RepID=A0AAV1VDX1_9STRA